MLQHPSGELLHIIGTPASHLGLSYLPSLIRSMTQRFKRNVSA